MKTATMSVRIHRDGEDVWLDLGEWLRTCAPYDLYPLRLQGGLCRVFSVRNVDAIDTVMPEPLARQTVEDGYAVLYQSAVSGIELWTPVGIPVRWDVNLSSIRALEPAVDTVPMEWECKDCADAEPAPGLPAICNACGTAWFEDGTVPRRPTPMQVTYLNYKGVTRLRWIIPKRTFFGSNEWHPEPQWFLEAFDVEKVQVRTFALNHLEGTGNFLRVMAAASESIRQHAVREGTDADDSQPRST